MPEIMYAQVVKARASAKPPPRLVKVDQMTAVSLTNDDELVASDPR
jgi:hypothetical protein